MREEDLLQSTGEEVDREAFPDALEQGGARLAFRYRHEPGADLDGIAIEIPLASLNQLDVAPLDWLVPGMLVEKIEVLLRGLPKRIRTRFSPIRETAEGAAEALEFAAGDLFVVLAAHLTRLGGVTVHSGDFDRERIPEHLRMRMIIRNDAGEEVASSRDIGQLKSALHAEGAGAFRSRVRSGASDLEATGLLHLPDRPLPESVELLDGVGSLTGWPTVIDEGETVGVRIADARPTAMRLHTQGVRRALCLRARDALDGHLDWLLEGRGLAVSFAPLGDGAMFRTQLELLVIDAVFIIDRGSTWSIRDHGALVTRFDAGFPDLSSRSERVVDCLEQTLGLRTSLLVELDRTTPSGWKGAIDDMRSEVERLLPTRFSAVGWSRIREVPRRLEATSRRLRRLTEKGPQRDQRDREELAPWIHRLERARRALSEHLEFIEYEHAVNELRIHLSAPALAAPGAASPRRLQAAWDRVRALSPAALADLS